jgi:GT2 family glycosyltransferase
MPAKISISIVSHGHIHLINELLGDFVRNCRDSPIELLLTLNLEETLPFVKADFPFPVEIIRNAEPLGFSANHNRAFALSSGQFFCVMNPDVRLNKNPFPTLTDCLRDISVGLVAPLVVNQTGELEDSARRFPTPFKILCKVFGRCKGGDYAVRDGIVYPDWVGGMFMLFRHEVFAELGGFDTRYFLYYEDVDLCARLRLLGYEVALCPDAKVIHHAHRSSHSSLKFMKWHVASMARFFCSPPFLKILWRRLTK